MQNLIAVAVGGALGALSRYGLGLWISNKWNHGFPLHTFIINITGAFLLGFINIILLERYAFNPIWRIGIGVGFLGAFTTFSTFGYEVFTLIQEGNIYTAMLYTVLSILVGFTGVAIGIGLARSI